MFQIFHYIDYALMFFKHLNNFMQRKIGILFCVYLFCSLANTNEVFIHDFSDVFWVSDQ